MFQIMDTLGGMTLILFLSLGMGYSNLSFDFSQDGEKVEPFRILCSDFEF
jgi:hypothetical protein